MLESHHGSINIPVPVAEKIGKGFDSSQNGKKQGLTYTGRLDHPRFMQAVMKRMRHHLSHAAQNDGKLTILDVRENEARIFQSAFDGLEDLEGKKLVETLITRLNKSIVEACKFSSTESGNRLSGIEFEKMLTRLLKEEDPEAIRQEDYLGRRTIPWFKTEGLQILQKHMGTDKAGAFLDLLLTQSQRDIVDQKTGSISCYSVLGALKRFK